MKTLHWNGKILFCYMDIKTFCSNPLILKPFSIPWILKLFVLFHGYWDFFIQWSLNIFFLFDGNWNFLFSSMDTKTFLLDRVWTFSFYSMDIETFCSFHGYQDLFSSIESEHFPSIPWLLNFFLKSNNTGTFFPLFYGYFFLSRYADTLTRSVNFIYKGGDHLIKCLHCLT